MRKSIELLIDGGFICKGLQTSDDQVEKELPTTTSKNATTTKESAVKPSKTSTRTTTTLRTTRTTTSPKIISTTTPVTTPNDQNLTKTVSGHVCQAWDSQRPHRHRYGSVGSHNFCRNPDNEPFGLWCYTTNPKVRWELCTSEVRGYKMTEEEKKTEFVSKTVSGRTCQLWNVQWPHKHGYGYTGNHNYCRNPSNRSSGSWCYTTDPKKRWENCKPGKLKKLSLFELRTCRFSDP